MRRKVVFTCLFTFLCHALYAQKYMARTGRVSFFSASKFENIEAINNEAAAIADVKSGDLVFQAAVKSFKFANALMQQHFNEDYMESDKFPKSDFKGKIVNIKEVNFSSDGTYKVNVSGKLTIHGVTHTVEVPGTITVKGKTITTKTKFSVAAADYGIKIPSVMSAKISGNIEISVNSDLNAI